MAKATVAVEAIRCVVGTAENARRESVANSWGQWGRPRWTLIQIESNWLYLWDSFKFLDFWLLWCQEEYLCQEQQAPSTSKQTLENSRKEWQQEKKNQRCCTKKKWTLRNQQKGGLYNVVHVVSCCVKPTARGSPVVLLQLPFVWSSRRPKGDEFDSEAQTGPPGRVLWTKCSSKTACTDGPYFGNF